MTEPKTVTLFGHTLTFSSEQEIGVDLYASRNPNLVAQPPNSKMTVWYVSFSPKYGEYARATGNSLKQAEANLASHLLSVQEDLEKQLLELSVLDMEEVC